MNVHEYVWKYIDSESSTVQHALVTPKRDVSLCGKTPVWYGGSWGDKREKLLKLPKCKNCLRLVK